VRPTYKVESGKILADVAVLRLRYVWRNENPATWDSAMVHVATLAIAARLAYAITNSASVEQTRLDELRIELQAAKSIDGVEEDGEVLGDFPLYAARFDGERARDSNELHGRRALAAARGARRHCRLPGRLQDAAQLPTAVVRRCAAPARNELPGGDEGLDEALAAGAVRFQPVAGVRARVRALVHPRLQGWRAGRVGLRDRLAVHRGRDPRARLLAIGRHDDRHAPIALPASHPPIRRRPLGARPGAVHADPMDERGKRPTDTLTLSAKTGAITLTLGAGAAGSGFSAADVGRELVAGIGRATITAVASETSASATVIVGFDATNYAAGLHRLLDSPRSTLTPSAKDPVGVSITLTADIATWRAADVGNVVRINGGIVRITSISSETVANATITQELAAVTIAPPDTWVLESPIWNEYDGFPSCSTFHEQRLLFAGAPGDPQQIAFSQSGAQFDFTPGTLDTDALVRAIATDEQNAIEYLAADTVLMALTYGGEFTLRGGIEKPITPTNIQVKPKTNYGAARVRPVKVQKERVFAQRSGTQLVAIQYAEENDSFGAEDISILSEHLFTEGVVEIAYQRRPVPSLYCVLESGGLAVGTIDRNQNILGWAPWETDGAVESICSIPRGKTDEVWAIVRRTVNGATVRYVERFEETFEALYGQTGYPYGYTVDCAIEKSSATPFTTIGGLGHLEGETVAVLADGYNAGTYTVAGAEITLTTPAKKALAGLGFSALLEPMPPELPTSAGSARGRPVRATEATLLVHQSLGGKINGVPLPTRSFGDAVLDTPPPLVTGERRVDGLSGWERGEPLVRVEQDDPLPMHVLAVIQKLVVNP